MQEQVMNWLLENENPSVRYATLTTLLNKPESDPDVVASKQDIMLKGPVPNILEKQNSDGSWDVPDRFYLNKYKGTVWTVMLLAELGASPENARVKKACEFLLTHSQDPESGGFSVQQSKKTQKGLPGMVIPCLTGNMVFSLLQLGYMNDARLEKAIEWILRYQRTDDGEKVNLSGQPYERFESCFGKHSCHMGVAKALKALSRIPPTKRNKQVKAKLDELIEHFLIHRLFKKSHQPDEISRPGWLKLGFPLMYQTDILELSEILTDLEVVDPRMDEAIEIIRNKPIDGKWNLENSFNGKMTVSIEKKGIPSKWITLKAMKVLSKIG